MARIHELINQICLVANEDAEELLELIHDLLCGGVTINDFRRLVSLCLVVGYQKSKAVSVDSERVQEMIEQSKKRG